MCNSVSLIDTPPPSSTPRSNVGGSCRTGSLDRGCQFDLDDASASRLHALSHLRATIIKLNAAAFESGSIQESRCPHRIFDAARPVSDFRTPAPTS
jgi:hypothetical protein